MATPGRIPIRFFVPSKVNLYRSNHFECEVVNAIDVFVVVDEDVGNAWII